MEDVNEQKYEQSFDISGRADLTLRNVRGSIEIMGWDKPQVTVVAVKKLGSEWGAKESFDETDVEMEQDGSHVRVRTRRKGGHSIFAWIGIGRTLPLVSYTVHVPVCSDVSVRTVNGQLNVSGLIGSIYLRTVEGAITMNQLSGQVITSGVDATVEGNEIGGTLAAKSVSGSVVVSHSQLSSFWGKGVSGDVRLETTIDPNGSYELSSVEGSFSLRVPSDSRADADMSSVSGKASCELPCKVTEQTIGRWRALVNGGGSPISLKTVSGNLSIVAAPVVPVTSPQQPEPAAAAPSANAEWPEMSILKAVEHADLTVEQAIAKLGELDRGARD